MTKEQFKKAHEGLTGFPLRHYQIDGRVAVDLKQLYHHARISGLDPDAILAAADGGEIAVPTPVVVPKVEKPAPVKKAEAKKPAVKKQTPAKAPVKPKAKDEHKVVETKATESTKDAALASSDPVLPGQEFNAELIGTMKYSDLLALARSLGVDPVPAATAELIDAIGAKWPS